ncbi:MAG: hypothetical protein KGJ86_08705, partial [Chloroflexota bacterium]|nr:hypothetical protein [Chloroflexota bacterium]
SPVVDQLVRRRLVSRAEHPGDRRITMVDLTDSGRGFIEAALLVRNQRMVEALQRLSDGELKTVVAAFDILSRATSALSRQEVAAKPAIGA